jgi:hypothetical protein
MQRWELHNQQQRQQARAAAAAASSSGPEVVRSAHQQQAAAAAAAVANWGRVDRGARAALKKASVHSVLELEVQVLQLLEQVRVWLAAGGRVHAARQAECSGCSRQCSGDDWPSHSRSLLRVGHMHAG